MSKAGIGGHEECRLVICAVCLSESGQKCTRTVSDSEVGLIKEYISDSYNTTDPRFATGICEKCHRKLGHLAKKSEDQESTLMVSSQFCVTLPVQTRSFTVCQCTICTRARIYGGAWNKFRKDFKSGKDLIKLGKGDKLCPKCFSKIYRGSNHSQEACRSKETLAENLSVVDPKILKKALQKQNIDVIDKKDAPVAGPSHVWTTEDAKLLKKKTKVSGEQLKKILQVVRTKEGPGHVQPYIRENMAKDKKVFAPYFDVQKAKFQESETVPDMDREVPVLFCHEVDGFIDKAASIIGKSAEDLDLKLGGDSGKGSLKTTLTMTDPSPPPPSKKARVTHKDGVQALASMRGQHCFILASLPNRDPKIGETYDNMKLIFDLVKIRESKYWSKFTFTGDLKIIMCCLGLMACGSKYGCPHGECSKDTNGNWICGDLRTFQSIIDNSQAWKASGLPRTEAKQFKNCVHDPLIMFGDPNGLVIQKVCPPGLHLYLGVNHILKGFLKVWPPLQDWLENHGIVFMKYHGETLEGNEVKKVLRLLDELKADAPNKFAPFIRCMKDFGSVAHACFKTDDLQANYKETIKAFSKSFKVLKMKFNVTENLKIHEINVHVSQWIDMFATSLGGHSEHEVEGIHSQFDRIWKNYNVKDIKSKSFAKNWKLANVELNYENS